jgi:transposase
VPAELDAVSREDLLALIGLLQRQNAALAEANVVLAARVAELEKRVGRDSGNSNMPPSTDVFGRPKDDNSAGGGASARISRRPARR